MKAKSEWQFIILTFKSLMLTLHQFKEAPLFRTPLVNGKKQLGFTITRNDASNKHTINQATQL